jgi:hypothetical protein
MGRSFVNGANAVPLARPLRLMRGQTCLHQVLLCFPLLLQLHDASLLLRELPLSLSGIHTLCPCALPCPKPDRRLN